LSKLKYSSSGYQGNTLSPQKTLVLGIFSNFAAKRQKKLETKLSQVTSLKRFFEWRAFGWQEANDLQKIVVWIGCGAMDRQPGRFKIWKQKICSQRSGISTALGSPARPA
jgi:hypothetical protein